MKLLRTAIVLGAGYVLGARAGRERYEQIANLAQKLWESGPVRSGREKVSETAQSTFQQGKESAAQAFQESKEAAASRLQETREQVFESVRDMRKNDAGSDEIRVEAVPLPDDF